MLFRSERYIVQSTVLPTPIGGKITDRLRLLTNSFTGLQDECHGLDNKCPSNT